MAERRMFAKSIVDTDAFFELPVNSQLLYFHLSMQADDDGFVASPVKITRACGATKDDLEKLISCGYLIPFQGVVCIRHWRVNNLIRKDRYKPTYYQKEARKLVLGSDGIYELKSSKKTSKKETEEDEEVNGHAPSDGSEKIKTEEGENVNWHAPSDRSEKIKTEVRSTKKRVLVDQNGKMVNPVEDSIGKVSIGKVRGEEVEGSYKVPSRVRTPASATALPEVTLAKIERFILDNGLNVNAEKFFCHYSALSWINSKGKPVNWRRKLFDWHKTELKRGSGDTNNPFLKVED